MNRKQTNTRLAWQSGLAGELRRLEDNLEHLYQLVGVSTSNRIIGRAVSAEDDGLLVSESLDETETKFERVIDEYLVSINSAAGNICSMISEQTEFDLPIPVHVLMRMAAKVGLLRWKDYKKRPNGLIKEYIYSLTPYLIDISLNMIQSTIDVLGTNMIPYTSFINQNLIRILEWTRSSNLMKHDESSFHKLRSKLFAKLTFMLERLSLNINLEPQFLKTLVETELIENLEELYSRPSEMLSLRDEQTVCALTCLEKLVVVYSSYFEPITENKLRGYVTKTCVDIYRDFKPNHTMELACRKQLLLLLITISNTPFASSTSEVAYNIFEQAKKVESDPEITSLLFRAIRMGLAHRPTIVTHFDVYECFGRPMLSAKGTSHITNGVKETLEDTVEEQHQQS